MNDGYRRMDEYGIDIVDDNQVIDNLSPSSEDRTENNNDYQKFKEEVSTVKKELEEVYRKLVQGETEGLDINDKIRKFDGQVREFVKVSKNLTMNTDGNTDLRDDYKQMAQELFEVKNNLKKLKQEQVKQYNVKVDATNEMINQLRRLNNPSVNSVLEGVVELSKNDTNITRWDASLKYLDGINYDRLNQVNRLLDEVNNKIYNNENIQWTMVMWDLHKELERVENEITRIKSEIKDDMTLEDVERLRQDVNTFSDSLNTFRAKLENNKDKIEEEDYKEFIDRYTVSVEEFIDLNSELNEKGIVKATDDPDKNKVYNELMGRVNTVNGSVNSLNYLVNSLFGNTNTETKDSYLEYLNNNLVKNVDLLEKDVEDKYKEEKIDKNQYDNLKKEIEKLRNLFDQINDNLKEPEMVKNADIYSILDKDINNLSNEINSLNEEIINRDGPIKREDKKDIDSRIKKLENEARRLEKTLESYKDRDANKYNSTMEEFNKVKEKLNELNKNYRGKCPLLVKTVKSAKNFFKQHKKIVLIVAGLAAFALISNQVLIPAIIHGNIMIAGASPTLRPFIKFCNKILGGIIGAKKDLNGIWTLANGNVINPSCAATSLLKGLAISGVGSTAMVAPVIVAIKKLITKMNIKQKLLDGFEKGKITGSEVIANTKKKLGETKNKLNEIKSKKSKKSEILMTEKDFINLLVDYRRSKMSVEEYCNEYELTEEEITFLKAYDAQLQKNIKENTSKKRRNN